MNQRAQRFRQAIADFIAARKEAKSKGDAASAAKYEYANWLADAARRVGQLQAATHVSKATHPDAQGSSLFVPATDLPARVELGSHALGTGFTEDVVGNAAALDVYKLLKVEVDDRRLLDWMQTGDADLLAALSNDPATAQALRDAFCGLMQPKGAFVSHTLAKQVYWCHGEDACDDAHYHLLQPMFPSSLMHAVHACVHHSLFDESIRQARKEDKPRPGPIPEYRQLAARKLGGAKPQNISQLNSERGGVNYLLASLPPQWTQQSPRKLLQLDTVFRRLLYFEDMRKQLEAFAAHLASYQRRRMEEDRRRRQLERDLSATLAAFGAACRTSCTPGWTRDTACDLPLCEQLWLDPQRVELPSRDEEGDQEGHAADEAFKAAWEAQDWPDEVAERFAEWLNAWLRENHNFPMGDAELRHFSRLAIIDAAWPNPMRRDLPPKRDWHKEEQP